VGEILGHVPRTLRTITSSGIRLSVVCRALTWVQLFISFVRLETDHG